jgi:hypothetical protein
MPEDPSPRSLLSLRTSMAAPGPYRPNEDLIGYIGQGQQPPASPSPRSGKR